MGIDFIKKAAPRFRKGLDWRRIELATPTCSRKNLQQRRAPMRCNCGMTNPWRSATNWASGSMVKASATRGLDLIAVFKSPTAELKSALAASFGEACGTVQAIHSVARIAEITVC